MAAIKQLFLLIPLLICVFITSCNNPISEKQTNKLSSLISKRDSLEKVYEANRFDSLNYWRQEASNIEIAIKRNYVATKVDHKLSVQMNRFKSMQEIIDAESELGGEEEHEAEEKEMTIGRRMMLLNTQFKKVKTSLESLHSDISQHLVEPSKADIYLKMEESKVMRIENQLNQYLFVKNVELKEYIRLCKELRVFADSISKKS